MVGLLLAMMLATSVSAQAKWGPGLKCGYPENTHCYGVAIREGVHIYGSIAAEDNEVANVADWASGTFVDDEQWVSFEDQGFPEDWIENGITIGNRLDCCTAYPFYAEKPPGKPYREFIAPGPVASGSGQYNYDMIYDSEHNGAFHMYWSSATNTANFYEVARYGGGWPVFISEQMAGLEVAQEVTPYHAGRDEVAVFNGGEWLPWTGDFWEHDPGVCIGSNRELGAAGDMEWTPGHNEC